MAIVLRVLAFVLVCAAGYFAIPLAAVFAIKLGLFPEPPPGPQQESMIFAFKYGTIWVWLAASFAGLSFFLLRSRLRYLFLSLPVTATLIYLAGFMIYYG